MVACQGLSYIDSIFAICAMGEDSIEAHRRYGIDGL